VLKEMLGLTLLDHLDVVRQVDVGQVLDDDVEALVASEVHQLLLVRFVVVVEHLKKTGNGVSVQSA
jgi:hypothetical protein